MKKKLLYCSRYNLTQFVDGSTGVIDSTATLIDHAYAEPGIIRSVVVE